jgi:hypothetical protein
MGGMASGYIEVIGDAYLAVVEFIERQTGAKVGSIGRGAINVVDFSAPTPDAYRELCRSVVTKFGSDVVIFVSEIQ